MPAETLLAELRQHGGRVYVEEVTYRVASGAIEKIWIRGKPLEDLELRRSSNPGSIARGGAGPRERVTVTTP